VDIPCCPSCNSVNVEWLGGSPPFGPETWLCSGCGEAFETPPVKVWAPGGSISDPA
jgi:hypothetical protein